MKTIGRPSLSLARSSFHPEVTHVGDGIGPRCGAARGERGRRALRVHRRPDLAHRREPRGLRNGGADLAGLDLEVGVGRRLRAHGRVHVEAVELRRRGGRAVLARSADRWPGPPSPAAGSCRGCWPAPDGRATRSRRRPADPTARRRSAPPLRPALQGSRPRRPGSPRPTRRGQRRRYDRVLGKIGRLGCINDRMVVGGQKSTGDYRFGDLLALARQSWITQMADGLTARGYPDYRRSDAASVRQLQRGAMHRPTRRSLGRVPPAARKVADGLVLRGFAGRWRATARTRGRSTSR